MRGRFYRILVPLFSLLAFIIALTCFLFLDIRSTFYDSLNNTNRVCLISGIDALIGQNVTIYRGFVENSVININSSLTLPLNIHFDYITFIFLCLFTVTLFLMFFFFNKKKQLLFFTVLNIIFNICVVCQPLFMLLSNIQNLTLIQLFSPFYGNSLIPIGSIVFGLIMLAVESVFCAKIYLLFRYKPII